MEANDMKAMREALIQIEKMAHCDLANVYPKYRGKFNDMIGGIERIARAALSKPPRNCDVGTPEEQHCRFIEYCNACDCPMGCIHRKEFIGMLDARCASMLKCYIRWSQMPYAEEGAGDDQA